MLINYGGYAQDNIFRIAKQMVMKKRCQYSERCGWRNTLSGTTNFRELQAEWTNDKGRVEIGLYAERVCSG